MRKSQTNLFVLACLFLLTICLLVLEALTRELYDTAWSRQFGTENSDNSFSVAVDGAGNVVASLMQASAAGG